MNKDIVFEAQLTLEHDENKRFLVVCSMFRLCGKERPLPTFPGPKPQVIPFSRGYVLLSARAYWLSPYSHPCVHARSIALVFVLGPRECSPHRHCSHTSTGQRSLVRPRFGSSKVCWSKGSSAILEREQRIMLFQFDRRFNCI